MPAVGAGYVDRHLGTLAVALLWGVLFWDAESKGASILAAYDLRSCAFAGGQIVLGAYLAAAPALCRRRTPGCRCASLSSTSFLCTHPFCAQFVCIVHPEDKRSLSCLFSSPNFPLQQQSPVFYQPDGLPRSNGHQPPPTPRRRQCSIPPPQGRT